MAIQHRNSVRTWNNKNRELSKKIQLAMAGFYRDTDSIRLELTFGKAHRDKLN